MLKGSHLHIFIRRGEKNAIGGHLVHARSLEAAYFLDMWNPDITKWSVVPQNLDYRQNRI